MERQVNVQIVFLFILLLILSLVSTVGASIRSVHIIRPKLERKLTWLTLYVVVLLKADVVLGAGR